MPFESAPPAAPPPTPSPPLVLSPRQDLGAATEAVVTSWDAVAWTATTGVCIILVKVLMATDYLDQPLLSDDLGQPHPNRSVSNVVNALDPSPSQR